MRRIHFTREGRRFFIAVVLIGFAALNTGNNLIYLLFSMMLAISLISFIIAFYNLRGLACGVDFREPLYARMPMTIDISMENRKFIPSYSVSVVFPLNLSQPLYVPVVGKGLSRFSFRNVVIDRRGKYIVEDLQVRTGFPFLFLYVNRDIQDRKEFIVYPQIIDVTSFLNDLQLPLSERETLRKGHEGDFLFSREYVYGEESRNIDWKATAKTRKTMVKEYSERDEQFMTVILDNGGAAETGGFEKAVSVSASLCSGFIERGYYVRLITCGKVVPFGSGMVHLYKMLDILAEVRMNDAQECIPGEPVEGLSILVTSSDISGFSKIAPFCSRIIDARDL
jgi:uncharacterized protein (DUF58 family)